MSVSRRTVVIALDHCPGLGGVLIARTLARMDFQGWSADDLTALPPDTLIAEFRWPEPSAMLWLEHQKEWIESAETFSRKLDQHGISLLSAADAAFPAQIEQFDAEGPGLLYLYGNTKLIEATTFTVMSSRKSPPGALDLIESLTEKEVLEGGTLVCGHNTPEYQRAAIVPLRWGSPRILALDTGLFNALGSDLKQEPFRAARLWRYQFDPHTDLVVSCENPFAGGHKASNRKRDRLVAMLAQRLHFVQIGEGGNMDRLARRALQSGREVWVSDLTLNYRDYARLGAQITPA